MNPGTVSNESYPSDKEILTILDCLQPKIAASVVSKTNIIRIAVESHNPQETADIANAVVAA